MPIAHYDRSLRALRSRSTVRYLPLLARLRLPLGMAVGGLLVAGCSRAPAPSRVVDEAPAAAAERAKADTVRREQSAKNSNGTRKRFPPAPASLPRKTLLLAYEDFGPQALASGLLGQECYPFGACCCGEIGDRFEIRVVVIDGVTAEEARARYVTGPETGDYRIVTKAAALVFIRDSLADLRSGAPEDRIPTLEAMLAATELRIRAAFDRDP